MRAKAQAIVEMESNVKTKAVRDFIKTAAESGTAKDKEYVIISYKFEKFRLNYDRIFLTLHRSGLITLDILTHAFYQKSPFGSVQILESNQDSG